MLWHPVKPLQTRSKPAGFIVPCQAALTDRPPTGPEWSHEIKWDGYRLIARKDGDRVRLWARTATDYTGSLHRICAAVTALPVNSAVLDGEAIVFRPDGSSDFDALRSSEGQASATMVAFDLLEADGEDIRPLPIEERRRRLARLLKPKSARVAAAVSDGIQLSEALFAKGDAMFREACRMGLEGIISKRLGSRYVSGRTRAWLKTKNPDFAR